MRPKMNRALVGYILAGVAMLFLFLYLRFPGEIVTDFIRAALAARYPGTALSLPSFRPAFVCSGSKPLSRSARARPSGRTV